MYARAAARIGATRQVAQLWRCTACLAVHLHRSCTFCGRVTCVELVSTRLAWVSFLARNAALANFKQPWVRRRVLHVQRASIAPLHQLPRMRFEPVRFAWKVHIKMSKASFSVLCAHRVHSKATVDPHRVQNVLLADTHQARLRGCVQIANQDCLAILWPMLVVASACPDSTNLTLVQRVAIYAKWAIISLRSQPQNAMPAQQDTFNICKVPLTV